MKSLETGILLDFYGRLLTDKMRTAMEMYLFDDMSLGEIAESEGVSRQAIYDTIKRAERQLIDYEAKLGLASRFESQNEGLRKALYELNCGRSDNAREILAKLLEDISE